jgi:hypothetical protein
MCARKTKLGISRFWEHVVLPGWRAITNLTVLIFFLVLAVGATIWAILLQRVAFPSAAAGSSAEPISATVYVEKLPAQVSLQSIFTPGNATDNFSLKVKVTVPTRTPDPWLLVVECTAPPRGKRKPSAIPLISESVVAKQQVGWVLVMPESTKNSVRFQFTCFTGLAELGQTADTVVHNQDLNLSLPVLEQNPVAQSGLADAPLYTEKADGRYQDVVEVQALPGAPCPTPTPSPSPASPSAGSSSPAAVVPSPSPAATSSQSLAATTSPSAAATSPQTPTTTSSSSNSATMSAAASPTPVACYTRWSPDATFVKYSFPASAAGTTVATSETLNNVTLSDDRIDSVYPQGMITTNQVTWQGGVDLGPSLIATNLASAARQNKDAFWAGLLYGIAAALAIPYFVEFYREWQKERDVVLKSKSPQGGTRPARRSRWRPQRRPSHNQPRQGYVWRQGRWKRR